MKPEDITIKPLPSGTKAAIMAGDRHIGDAYMMESGLWYQWDDKMYGATAAWTLRAIADRLDDLNKDWNEKLDAAYKALPDEGLEG
jgi:hypothetical protein